MIVRVVKLGTETRTCIPPAPVRIKYSGTFSLVGLRNRFTGLFSLAQNSVLTVMTRRELSVLLPASTLSEVQNLRQKTPKAGVIGRALAIFRVDKVCIYNDDDPLVKNQEAEAELISKLLCYMETPQYLRKLLFPRARELRYAGLLPPLRTPHHPLEGERNEEGDYREAVALSVNEGGSTLEIGLLEKGFMRERVKVGERLTVKLGKRSEKNIAVVRAAKAEVGKYWGYGVSRSKTIAEGLKVLKADYTIGTSRHGKSLDEAIRDVRSSGPRNVAVAFGGPRAGLHEICRRQGSDEMELFDVTVNTIPEQGTATVRTEEALLATLALLNALGQG